MRDPPQPDTIICGASRKRKPEQQGTPTTKHPKTSNEPYYGNRPIVPMILEWEEDGSHCLTVNVLLDTGCTTPLLSQARADLFRIPRVHREEKVGLCNFAGELVKGVGEAYLVPLLLRHKQHYTKEVFEIAPLEPGVDLFLPFWWVVKHAPQGAWDSTALRFNSDSCRQHCTREAASAFALQLDPDVLQNPEARVIGYVSAATEANEIARVPIQFRPLLDIMGKEAADVLPEHRSYDHEIRLKEGETTPWGPIYPLSETELETLREWLKEMLRTGKIRRSTSSVNSPILFVPKPHGCRLRLCVDYRGLNRVTIANRYLLPLMSKLQDRMWGAQFLAKIDLKNGYHLVRIKEGDEWKTAFRTHYGLYQFLVMTFDLCSVPATFQYSHDQPHLPGSTRPGPCGLYRRPVDLRQYQRTAQPNCHRSP